MRRAILATVLGMFTVVLAGCQGNSIPRLDHVHSPENLAKIRSASEAFDEARSQQSGFPAQMRANLEAQLQLRRTVAESADRFYGLADLALLQDITWEGLEDELYADLGYLGEAPIHQALARAGSAGIHEDIRRTLSILSVVSARLHIGRLEVAARMPEAWAGARDQDVEAVRALVRSAIMQSTRQMPELFTGDSLTVRQLRDGVRSGYVAFTAEEARAVLVPRATRSDTIRDAAESVFGSAGGAGRALIVAPQRPVELIVAAADADSLSDRIGRRLALLARATKVFSVLVKGERARVALLAKAQRELAANVESQLTPEASGAPEAQESEGGRSETAASADSIARILREIRDVVQDFWEQGDVNEAYRGRAGELARLLRDAAAESRDPATVYSLVPLVGEGLGDDDLRVLSQYVTELERLMRSLQQDAELSDALAGLSDLGTQSEDADESTIAVGDFITELDSLGAMLEKAEKVGDWFEGDDAADQILEVANFLQIDLDLTEIEQTIEVVRELREPLEGAIGSGDLGDAALDGLFALVAGAARDDVPLDAKERKALRSILQDIRLDSAASSRRITDLLLGIERLHQRLYEENVRHYLALSLIAADEIRRWTLLHELSSSVERAYVDSDGLFRSTFDGVPDDPESGGKPTVGWTFVATKRSDRVLPTLRVLGETARAHQYASPSAIVSSDGVGSANMAADRLARAIGVLQAYELLTTTNRRLAADNSIALIGEVREHEIAIDHIVISGTELEIRAAFDALIAFHATGITQEDLNLVAQFVQAGLLAFIGSEV